MRISWRRGITITLGRLIELAADPAGNASRLPVAGAGLECPPLAGLWARAGRANRAARIGSRGRHLRAPRGPRASPAAQCVVLIASWPGATWQPDTLVGGGRAHCGPLVQVHLACITRRGLGARREIWRRHFDCVSVCRWGRSAKPVGWPIGGPLEPPSSADAN